MGLDISKITNAELKKLAYIKDNGDGSLNAEEFAVFKQEAAGKEGISAEDFNQAMGLYKSTPAATTEASTTDKTEAKITQTKRQERRSNRAAENVFLRQLATLVTDTESSDKLKEKLNELNTNLGEALVNYTLNLIDKMDQYKDIKAVEKGHDEIIKEIKKDNIDNELQREIIDILERRAKSNIQKNIKKEILTQYEKQKEADPTKTNEKIMDEIKEGLKKNNQFKKEYKEMYKSVEKNDMRTEAGKEYILTVNEDTENTKRRKVRKEAKAALKDDGKFDKYAKKFIRHQKFGDAISGEKKMSRIIEEIQSRKNLVNTRYITDNDTVHKQLSDKALQALTALKSAGIVKQHSNGDWDLSELSSIIKEQVGADYMLNRHAKIDKAIGEKVNTQAALSAAAILKDLSEKEAKELVKLCGYDIEGKDWGRAALGGLIGFLTGAAAGAGHEALNPAKEGDLTIQHDLNFKLTVDGGELDAALKDFGDNANVTVNGNTININIHQLIKLPGDYIRLFSRIASAGLTSGLVSAALGFLSNMKDIGEIPVTATNFEETDVEKYIEHVKNATPEYAPALAALAMAYVGKDNQWDKAGFLAKLNEIAGDRSKLNRDEFVGQYMNAVVENDKAKNTVEETKEETKTEEVKGSEAIEEPKPIEEKTDKIITTENVTHKWKSGESWQAIVLAYYPEAFEGLNYNEVSNKIKPFVDAFRRTHGIKFTQGLPVNQVVAFLPITVDGKTYSPKQADTTTIDKCTSDEWFGYGSKYFTKNWNIPTNGSAKLNGQKVYTSVRQSDQETKTGLVEKETQNALLPQAVENVTTTVIVQNADGTTYTEVIKPLEKEEK